MPVCMCMYTSVHMNMPLHIYVYIYVYTHLCISYLCWPKSQKSKNTSVALSTPTTLYLGL